jgi:hypothetical protein
MFYQLIDGLIDECAVGWINCMYFLGDVGAPYVGAGVPVSAAVLDGLGGHVSAAES